MRQIALDTESTGLSPEAGHRLIEIGCVELYHRKLTGKTFQAYINPKRESEAGALAVHGITTEFLADKPEFKDIVEAFLDFIGESELIIHNAPFDTGFINHELQLAGRVVDIKKRCSIVDTLVLARKQHPGQRNNLDALCKRYSISNAHRKQHGALLDAELLSEVYLAMTAGQKQFVLEDEVVDMAPVGTDFAPCKIKRNATQPLKVIRATSDELAEHEAFMQLLETSAKK